MNIRKELKSTVKEFPVVGFDKPLTFKKMDAGQFAALLDWQRSIPEDDPNKSKNDLYWKARVIAASLVNKDGSFIYTNSQEDLDELSAIDADVFAELYVIAGRLIGFVAPEMDKSEDGVTSENQEVATQPKN